MGTENAWRMTYFMMVDYQPCWGVGDHHWSSMAWRPSSELQPIWVLEFMAMLFLLEWAGLWHALEGAV